MLKKTVRLTSYLVVLLLVFSSCTVASVSSGGQSVVTSSQLAIENKYQFMDASGAEVEVACNPEKVVALFGSYGEAWLQAGGELRGITDDYEKNHKEALPETVQKIGSVKEPNLELIFDIQPDFVILSPDIPAQVEIGYALEKAGIPHGFFKQETYQDYLSILKIFTDILQAPERYTQIEKEITSQVDAVLSQMDKEREPLTILLVRGTSTGVHVLGEDHPVGKMLAEFGCVNMAEKYPSILTELNPEIVLDENPDFILLVPMGDTEAANASFWNMVHSNPLWEQLDAVQSEKVVLLPKELFQLKPNAKWGESYEYLANVLFEGKSE